jgi:hypothetical protein
MIRMLVVGYMFAIRSERRVCAEVQVNLALQVVLQTGIEDKIPDHSVGVIDGGRSLPYRASTFDCAGASSSRSVRPQARKFSRDIDENIRNQVRVLANTEAFQQSRRACKKVEMKFAQ